MKHILPKSRERTCHACAPAVAKHNLVSLFFCVCPAGVESCPAEVEVEVEAAFRLSRATWLALGGWYDLTLTTPGLAWPGPAQAGFLGSPMSAPRSETSSKAPIITGLAACRRRCLLL